MTGKLRDVTGAKSQKKGARDASRAQQQSQREMIAFLEEREKLPRAFKEAALTDVGASLGYSFDEQGNIVTEGTTAEQRAMSSPVFEAIMGSRQAGEEAIARTASATGGLRSGSTIGALTDYNQQLENQAFLTALQEEQRKENILLGQPTNEMAIAQSMGNIGNIQAQGIQAAAGANRQGFQDLLGLAQTGADTGQAIAAMMSDVRLKTNIEQIGNTSHHGIKKYVWDWKEESGKTGSEEGYLAQEVREYFPDLVAEGNDGYLRINKQELEARLNGNS